MWMRLLTIIMSVLALTAAGADDQRFSVLNQINEHNVSKLGLVWSKELGTTRGLEATPVGGERDYLHDRLMERGVRVRCQDRPDEMDL